jgi:sRNA-binding protein
MSPKSDPRIIELLARRFPRAFFVNGERRRPLKIGIIRDLVDADIGIPGTQLRQALAVYTNAPGYLRACREGEDRIGLSGEAAGVVTADEALHAAGRVKPDGNLVFRRFRQVSNGSPASRASSPPTSTSTSAGPKRLGLADLKAAWLRRQAKQATT